MYSNTCVFQSFDYSSAGYKWVQPADGAVERSAIIILTLKSSKKGKTLGQYAGNTVCLLLTNKFRRPSAHNCDAIWMEVN